MNQTGPSIIAVMAAIATRITDWDTFPIKSNQYAIAPVMPMIESIVGKVFLDRP